MYVNAKAELVTLAPGLRPERRFAPLARGLNELLPPPGGYVIILVCMCVCVCVCVYVCLSVNTITQEIINILTPNFAHTFAIA